MNGMIKGNEIRVGNYVYNKHMEVDEIGHSTFLRFRHPTMDGDYGLYPIPITEEWLLRMGGKKINQSDWEIKFGAIKFYIRINVKCYSSIEGIYLSDRIQHVHQLQNLYFALTGQEIEMKR